MNKSKRVLTALALVGTAFAATATTAGSAQAVAGIGEGPGGLLAAPGFLLADLSGANAVMPVGQGDLAAMAEKAMKEKQAEREAKEQGQAH
ncbi:hypothetical protein ACFVFS_05220 [Kitasatospora sp. NPDC057692]|uniref:hypothetical protein n=1 Tax=Kitasatospora sp. NPDC057692 TaxID=3346215 RepID=UPI0036C7BAAF